MGSYLDEGVDVVHQSLGASDDELVHTRDGVGPDGSDSQTSYSQTSYSKT